MATLTRERWEQEVSDIIRRVQASTRTPGDIATLLLIKYQWDETKLNDDFMQSREYRSLARYFVEEPHFDIELRTRCRMCNVWEKCQNIGCGHYLCDNCVRVDVELKLCSGHLEVMCPYSRCGKYLSHQFIKEYVCDEALEKYNSALIESLKRSRPPLDQKLFERLKKFLIQLIIIIVREIWEIIREVIRQIYTEQRRLLVDFVIAYLRGRFF